MTVAISKTSPAYNTEGKKVEVDIFHIDQIPDVMENMGWEVAPKLMRHWFSISPAAKWTEEVKTNLLNANATTLKEKEYNDTIVKMDWVLRNHDVNKKFQEIKGKWNSQKGIDILKKRLELEGYAPGKTIRLGYSNSARVLDASAQVNFIQVGEARDTINDWYGAIGKANLKLAVRGYTSIYERRSIFVVEAIGAYIKDTYDFVDGRIIRNFDFEKPEMLGVWSKERILNKAETIAYFSSYSAGFFGGLARIYSGFVPIWNSDFRDWQDKHNSGGDFILFSDVFWFFPSNEQKVIFL